MNKMKKEYSSPEIEVMDFRAEGTFCTASESTPEYSGALIEQWHEDLFKW